MAEWTEEKEARLAELQAWDSPNSKRIIDYAERLELRSLEEEKRQAEFANTECERRFTAKDLEAAFREGYRDATNGLFTSELHLDKQWNNSEAKQKIDGC